MIVKQPSKGGLQWHVLNQHMKDETFVKDSEQLQKLNEKAKQVIDTCLCPENCFKEFKNFNVIQNLGCMRRSASNLMLCKKQSSENVYINGCNLIVLDSSLNFPGLSSKIATSLSI